MAEENSMLDVKISGKFAVGVQHSGHAPVINVIDWCPFAGDCPAFHTDTMLATGSEVGTGIFGLLPGTPEQIKWMGLEDNRFKKLYQSPGDVATTALKFHPGDGRVLATGSESGVVSILGYCANHMTFIVADTFESEQSRISSMSWHHSGKYLICSSASQIFFLRLLLIEGGEIGTPSFKLELLGKAEFPDFPDNTRISTLCHSTYAVMFSGATCAKEITTWSLDEGDGSIWRPISSVGCLAGLISMSLSLHGDVLTTLHVGDVIQQWQFDDTTSPRLKAGRKFARAHHSMTYGRMQTNSCASALDSTRWGRMASAGKDDASTCNTLLVHHISSARVWKVFFKQSRRPRQTKDINCLKFNPRFNWTMDFATGGSGGIVYIWAVLDTPFNLKRQITHDGDEDEEYYYRTQKRKQKKLDKLIPEAIDERRCEEWKDDDLPNRRPFLFDDFNGFTHSIVSDPVMPSDDFAAEADETEEAVAVDSSGEKSDETASEADDIEDDSGGSSKKQDEEVVVVPSGAKTVETDTETDEKDDSGAGTGGTEQTSLADKSPSAGTGGASHAGGLSKKRDEAVVVDSTGDKTPLAGGSTSEQHEAEVGELAEKFGMLDILQVLAKNDERDQQALESFSDEILSELDSIKAKVTSHRDEARSQQKQKSAIMQKLVKNVCTRLDSVDLKIGEEIKEEPTRKRKTVSKSNYISFLKDLKDLSASTTEEKLELLKKP